MKIIDYIGDRRWELCDDNHKSKCKVPNWFLGLVYQESEYIKDIEDIKYALETGTYRGYTTEFLCDHFEKVYSIEKYPDQNFYGGDSLRDIYTQLEAKYSNLKINIGDSSSILPSVLSNHVNESFVFIFDAHNGPNGPLLEELEAVNRYSTNKNHIIIIDDWGDFTSQHDLLKTKIYNINSNYTIKEAPFGRAGILIAYIKK